MDTDTPQTLAEIRDALGATGVRDAIERALATYPTVTDAARALGTKPQNLRRAAVRVGIEWEPRPGAPGSAGGKRAKTPGKKASRKNRQGK